MAFTTVQYIRFYAGTVPTSATVAYTVPASRQDVIKNIDVCNTTGSSITFFLQPVTGTSLFNTLTVPAFQTVHWTGTIVLNAGETVTIQAGGAGLHLTFSGLESQ